MPKQTLSLLPHSFAIHSLDASAEIPKAVYQAEVFFLGKTSEELSVVVPESVQIESDEVDKDWRILEVLGPLSLNMIGIMATISAVLYAANISIFVVSTFDTDHFLVKQKDLHAAAQALTKDGYKVILDE